MTYTEEQRAIIARMGDINKRIEAAETRRRTNHRAMANNLTDLGANLIAAIERSDELGRLNREYGDAFREFLDTL